MSENIMIFPDHFRCILGAFICIYTKIHYIEPEIPKTVMKTNEICKFDAISASNSTW